MGEHRHVFVGERTVGWVGLSTSRRSGPVERRCDQCGRVGTRRFVTIPSDHEGPTDGIDSFTVCKDDPACRKRRRERSYPDD